MAAAVASSWQQSLLIEVALPMRKRLLRRPVAALIVGCLAVGSASAQTLTKTQDLSFGAFAAGAGGTVTISPHSVRSATGDVTLMTGGQFSQGSAATFDVFGTPNASYQIMLPTDGQVTLTGSQGGSMSVSTFTSSPSAQGQLGLLGTQTLAVGAKISVGGNQATGSYSGTFNVTIAYE